MSTISIKDFGLCKYKDNEYRLIDKEYPKLEDFQLTEKDVHTIDNSDKAFKFSAILIGMILFICITSHLIRNPSDFISNIFGIILLGFLEGIPLIFFAIIIVGLVVNEIFDLFDKYSDKGIRRRKYTESVNEYNQEVNRRVSLYNKALLSEKRKTIKYWMSLSGRKFELEMGELFKKNGYSVEVTQTSNDHGIDINLFKGKKRIIVQCKQYAKPAGVGCARDLYGTLIDSHADSAILVCTSGFTRYVYEFVKDKKIELIQMDDILRMNNENVNLRKNVQYRQIGLWDTKN